MDAASRYPERFECERAMIATRASQRSGRSPRRALVRHAVRRAAYFG